MRLKNTGTGRHACHAGVQCIRKKNQATPPPPLRAVAVSLALLMLGVLSSAGWAGEANAEEVSYTYVSLEYEYSNVHDGSDGLTYGFSFEIADPIHIFGGWQESDLDVDEEAGIKADREGYLIGAGIKQDIAEGMTMQYRAGYLSSKTTVKIPAHVAQLVGSPTRVTEDDSGHYLEVGIRTLPRPKWELDGFVAVFEVGDYDNSMVFVTLERRVTENLGINLSFKNTEGDNASESWILAMRYHL